MVLTESGDLAHLPYGTDAYEIVSSHRVEGLLLGFPEVCRYEVGSGVALRVELAEPAAPSLRS